MRSESESSSPQTSQISIVLNITIKKFLLTYSQITFSFLFFQVVHEPNAVIPSYL